MTASRRRFGTLSAAVVVLALATGCSPSSTTSPSSPTSSASGPHATAAAPSLPAPETGSLVIVGRIVTMDEPSVAEALLIEDGVVAAVGTRDEVMALAGDQVPVIDIGQNVAYPGFIDAHAHWIGDRAYYGLESAGEALDAAVSRGFEVGASDYIKKPFGPHELLERIAAALGSG